MRAIGCVRGCVCLCDRSRGRLSAKTRALGCVRVYVRNARAWVRAVMCVLAWSFCCHLIRYKEAIDLFQERQKLAQATGDVAAEARAKENCARALLAYHKLENEASAALNSSSSSALSTQHLPPPVLRLPGSEDGSSGKDAELNNNVDARKMGVWERGDRVEGARQEMVDKQRGYVRSSSRLSGRAEQSVFADSQRKRMEVDERGNSGGTNGNERHGGGDARSGPLNGFHRQGRGECDIGTGVGELEHPDQTISAQVTQIFAEPTFVEPPRGEQREETTTGTVRDKKMTDGGNSWGEEARGRRLESSEMQPDESQVTGDIQSAIDSLQTLITAAHDDVKTRSLSFSRSSERGEDVDGGRGRNGHQMESHEPHIVQAGQGNVVGLPSSAADGLLRSSLVVGTTTDNFLSSDDIERKLFDGTHYDERRDSENDELDEMVRLLERSSNNNLGSRQVNPESSSVVTNSKAARRARQGGGMTEEIGHGSFNLSPPALIKALAVRPDFGTPADGTRGDQDGARQDSKERTERRKVQVT